MSKKLPTFSFQDRLALSSEASKLLTLYTQLYSRALRSLFSKVNAGEKASDLKQLFMRDYGLSARQFNACRVEVEGKVSSLKELQKQRIVELRQRLEILEARIAKLESKAWKGACVRFQIHQAKRKCKRFQDKLKGDLADQELGKVRLCFGGKKRFRQQFDLGHSPFSSHEEWKADWEASRHCQFFVLGSKDESSGNQSCTARIQENGKLTLRLRLPRALEDQYGKYLEISDVYFDYGHEAVLASLRSCEERKRLQSLGDKSYRDYGQAISYRFKVDHKGWRVFASTSYQEPKEWLSCSELGAIGVDINADHLAVAETDRFGNLLNQLTIPLHLYGKSSAQRDALIGEACRDIVNLALDARKPIVCEKLDFTEKKKELSAWGSPRYARMLSSLAYQRILSALQSRAWRFALHFHQVNPAYTSVIGRVKFSDRYGLSVHHAAAFCIARRYLGFSERPPRSLDRVPDGKGHHVAFTLPVRNRAKHVWSFWGVIAKKLKAALAAHFRAEKCRSTAPPGVCVT